MRHWILIAALVLAGLLPGRGCRAQTRFTYGLEWGYTGSAFQIYHYNYLSEDGVRADEADARFSYKSNGEVLFGAGLLLGRHFSTTVCSGLAGIYEGRNIVPVTLRTTFYPQGADRAGMLVFLDGGIAMPVNPSFLEKKGYLADAGAGYRIPVYKDFCLEVMLSARYAMDHPVHVHDIYTGEIVESGALRRSDSAHLGLTLSVALRF